MDDHACRACRGQDGHLVLDLGQQPACDYFPPAGDPGPDPVYPLQMWLCSSCGLAQLLADPTVPEEPRGAEPAALVAQAADAVARVAAAGLLPDRGTVAEYGSPHGGSWLPLLVAAGMRVVGEDEPADLVLDTFGLMHEPDQRSVDRVFGALRAPDQLAGAKGRSPHTLETVERLLGSGDQEMSAAELAEVTGMSRATAQRYLSHLHEMGRAEIRLRYGSGGRRRTDRVENLA